MWTAAFLVTSIPGCASSQGTAPADDRPPVGDPVRILMDLGIEKADFDAFDPGPLDAAPAGAGIFGDYPTDSPTTCRVAAALAATKMIADGKEGAAVIRCSDALWATAVVSQTDVELSHGAPGTKEDVRVAPR